MPDTAVETGGVVESQDSEFSPLAYNDPQDTDTRSGDDFPSVRSAADGASGGQTQRHAASKSADDLSGTAGNASGTQAEISDALLYRAIEHGLTIEDVRDFQDPKNLERTLNVLDRRIARHGRETGTGGQQAGATTGAQQSTGTASGTQADTTQAQGQQGTSKFELNLDPEVFDPEIVNAMKAMNDHYQSQIEQMRQSMGSVQQHFQTQQTQAFTGEMDRFFNSLEEHADIFGKGDFSQIDKTGQHFKARDEFVGEMMAYQQGRVQMGLQPLPADQLRQRTLQALYGDKIAAGAQVAARKKVTDQLRDEAGRFSAAPTNREMSDSLTPVQRAERAVGAKLKQYGLDE